MIFASLLSFFICVVPLVVLLLTRTLSYLTDDLASTDVTLREVYTDGTIRHHLQSGKFVRIFRKKLKPLFRILVVLNFQSTIFKMYVLVFLSHSSYCVTSC